MLSHDVMKDTVLVSLICRMPANTRKIDASRISTEADKDWIGVRKELLKSTERQAVTHAFSEMARFLKDRCAPGNVFRKGCYLLKTSLIESVQEKFEEQTAKADDAMDAFLKVYDERKQEARERLGDLYDEANYPSPSAYRQRTGMTLRYIEIAVPEAGKLGGKLHAEQVAAAEEEWKQTIEQVRLALRASMQKLVGHLCDVLKPDAAGDAKIVKKTTFNQFDKFLKFFAERDVTNDVQLSLLVGKAKSIMAEVDPELIREDDVFRAAIANKFGEVAAALDGMVEEQRGRLITFEEDEVEAV